MYAGTWTDENGTAHEVAIKEFILPVANLLERVKKEAKSLLRGCYHSDYVCRVHGYAFAEGRFWLVMERYPKTLKTIQAMPDALKRPETQIHTQMHPPQSQT